MQPTVLANVGQSARVVHQEILGPVLTALPDDDLGNAATWANDTPFGLGASTWSNTLSKVDRLIPKLRAGSVWVNSHRVLEPAMPFGSDKQPGSGHDMGKAAFGADLEAKSV